MAINVEMPLHKARELMAQFRSAMPMNLPIIEEDKEPPDSPNVLVDAVSLGGPSDGKQKPLVRHVIVKDLNKIGTRLKLEHPKTGVFSNKAPMGLYALFDGQSCDETPGPMAAEFCARNFHTKLLERLSNLPPASPDPGSVGAALRGTFEDLDRELIVNHTEVQDSCGAAVALLIGESVFIAVVGRCRTVLCEANAGAEEFSPVAFSGNFGQMQGRGVAAPVTQSLGDRLRKQAKGSSLGLPFVICAPVVQHVSLKGCDEHPFLLLTTSTVAAAMSPQELVSLAAEYPMQPRAACGEVASSAAEARAGVAQCTAVEVCFLPHRPSGDDKAKASGTAGPEPPPAKKAKLGSAGSTQSVRLRHILLKFVDGPPPAPANSADAKAGKKIVRSRQEAETVLRGVIKDLRKDLATCKKTPKDATKLINATSKTFTDLCRQLSECETARKGGSMCGDLGWISPEGLLMMGAGFKEVVEVLQPGQLSDIVLSEQGLHMVQRIA